MKKLGSKQKLSTAAHPQTDGQTERLNQTLEQHLRSYVNDQQDNWVELLPIAQSAYNTSPNEDMKMSPQEALYGRKGQIQRQELSNKTAPETTATAPKAGAFATELKTQQAVLQQRLQFIQDRMTKYYNQKRIKGPILRRGDKVYLLRDKQHSTLKTPQIRTKRPSEKLDFKKLGPFEIEEVLSETNYKLALPKTMRLRTRVFHIVMLEPALINAKLTQNLELEKNPNKYEVEKILDSKLFGYQLKYFIKWKNYPHEDNTWEPIKHL